MNTGRRVTDRPHRMALACMLVIGLAAFAAGRVSTRTDETVREVEARPVPSELPMGISRFHDANEGVTCWRVGGSGAISCLPDQWLLTARMDDTP